MDDGRRAAPRPLTAGREHVVPTLDEVARLAGVSRSTASRAINRGPRVSAATRAAVDAAVTELGFTPNRAARSLVTRRTDSIALVVPEPDERVLSDPFFAGTISGLTAALSASDLQLVLVLARPTEVATRTLRYLRNGHVDGAVVVSHHRGDALAVELERSGLPSVFIGRPLSGPRAEYVDVDNVAGGRLATDHLIRSGRRRIATVTGPLDMSAGVDRLRGWHDALADAGLPRDAVASGDFTTRGGARAARELLDRHRDLDAVFVASDLMAVGALGVLADAGLDVPGDVAVVGYDNAALAASASPPLTTVASPVASMARAAGELLVSRLTGSAPCVSPVILSPDLVVRASA
ncbi:LacI family DNA-binding transcriptional regulator [uncultured Cellulomonas sp.]|uniref:LacI family DNA-binding transcriptional regulator n=1 Tax=uncultured Cellulomonas sp. TaxID=189682 RepID=UPI002619F799|nr:LacI family DNA-binding transcriptional regulator [uncultured Cellulomonas sp.]